MRYVIGIDGGGTKSLLHMMDLEGRELLELRGGPTNMYATSLREVERELAELLDRAMEASGRGAADCAALCLGSAGADRPEEQRLLREAFRRCGIGGELTVTNDAETVLVAGSGKPEGITIVSGTGSIGFARDLAGHRARAGGWGHLIGDEGGGYDIGNLALRAAVRSEDGREPPTLLLPMLLKELGLERADQLLQFVYKTAGKAEIAALAKVVLEASQAGDRKALQILDQAAYELFLTAKTLVRALGFEDRPVTLVANGSVFEHIQYVYESFCRLIRLSYPRLSVTKPTRSAAYGAALIALHSLGRPDGTP